MRTEASRRARRTLFGLLGIVGLTALACQVAVSTAVALYANAAYPTRMFNVRNFEPPAEVIPLVAAYVGSVIRPGDTVIAGSSLSYGYPFAVNYSVSGALNEMGVHAKNVSVLAFDLEGIHDYVLCALKSRGLKLENLIVEIPIINETSWLAKNLSGARIDTACPHSQTTGAMFSFAFSALRSSDWVRLLLDGSIDHEPTASLPPTIPPSYFASQQEFDSARTALFDRIRTVYEEAQTVSDRAFLFVSPIQLVALNGRVSDEAERSVRSQFADTIAMCKAIAGPRCVDTSEMTENAALFYNVSHLNGVGAADLASRIRKAMMRP